MISLARTKVLYNDVSATLGNGTLEHNPENFGHELYEHTYRDVAYFYQSDI